MKPGAYVAIVLPDGRFVTRWKEQRAKEQNAITAPSADELRTTLQAKFNASMLKKFAVFQFVGWADDEELLPEKRGMQPEPVVAFGSVLSKDEVIERLREVIGLLESADDDGPFWTEFFVRSRTESGGRRRRPADKKRKFRRD